MLRWLVGALAVGSVVAVTATVPAVASGLQANSQRAEAQSARDEAMSRQIAKVSAQLRNVDPALASQLAVAELPAAADGELYSLEFGPGGDWLAVGGQGGGRLWDVRDAATPRILSELADADRVIYGFAFDPNGTRLVAGDATGHVLRWTIDADTAAAFSEIEQPGAGTVFVASSSDGRTLASLGRQASMRLWDTGGWNAEMTPRFDLPPDGSTVHHLNVTFSPDGRTLASGTTRREVARWSLAGDAVPVPLPPLTGFSSYVNDVAFLPGADRTVSCDYGSPIPRSRRPGCARPPDPRSEDEWERFLPGVPYRNPCAGQGW